MTKLRQVLATAAALILGSGLAVSVALNQAGQTHGMTTEEWCAAIDRVNDAQKIEHWFLAFPVGTEIPTAWPDTEGRVLGDCAAGTCTIAPGAAPHCAYSYHYEISPAVAGYRLAEVWSHPFIAQGWQQWALDTAGVHWFGSLQAVVAACRAQFTGAQCLNLLRADDTCWLLNDDSVCRFGQHAGVAEACPYGQVKARLPCTVFRGAGSERVDAERVWTDTEMDDL